MAPKGKGRAAAAPPKRKGAMQSQLNQLPLLKKPSELIGTQIKVPGAYWDGRMSDEEKAMLYLCGIRDYSALHTFASGAKGQAFELQEMGAAGTGSLEHGDASGEMFWMQYNAFPVSLSLCDMA